LGTCEDQRTGHPAWTATAPGHHDLQHRVDHAWLLAESVCGSEKVVHVCHECGFVQEGVKRYKVLKDGRFEDVVVMSIINESCPERRLRVEEWPLGRA